MVVQLSIISYNVQGFKDAKIDYLKSLLSKCDVLCIQEHWLYDSYLPVLKRKLNCHGVGLSSMSDSEFRIGRPFGGVATLWSHDKNLNYSLIACNIKELCVLKIEKGNNKIGLFNVYMPCDSMRLEPDDKFLAMLTEIKSLCEIHEFNNIILVGDFNTDLKRRQSAHTKVLDRFVVDESLSYCLKHALANVDYTFESKSCGTRHTLDHCVVSQNLQESIASYNVSHDIENMSDHSPVYLELQLEFSVVSYVNQHAVPKNVAGYNWCKATSLEIDQYSLLLDNILSVTSEPVSVTEHYDQIVNACLEAANSCIPKKRHRKGNRIYLWNEIVKEKKKKALFWHYLWVENGRPHSGVIFDIRICTRRAYHQAIKTAKRAWQTKEANNVIDAAENNRSFDFWSYIKKAKKQASPVAGVIGGQSNPEDIANMFADKYKELYSSVPYDERWSISLDKELLREYNQRCKIGACLDNHCIEEREVMQSIRLLKRGKADVRVGLSSDNFVHRCNYLAKSLASLFTKMRTRMKPIRDVSKWHLTTRC